MSSPMVGSIAFERTRRNLRFAGAIECIDIGDDQRYRTNSSAKILDSFQIAGADTGSPNRSTVVTNVFRASEQQLEELSQGLLMPF